MTRASDEAPALDPRTEERLLTRWLVSLMTAADFAPGGRAGFFRDLRQVMPTKTANHPAKATQWILRRVGRDVMVDHSIRVILDTLEFALQEFLDGRGSLYDEEQDVSERAERMAAVRCAALYHRHAERFDAVVAALPQAVREAYAIERGRALEWARAWEDQERVRLREAHANVTGLSRAREEALRQKTRADQAAVAASARVSQIDHERRQLERRLAAEQAENQHLRAIITELSDQTARIVADYERRLAAHIRGDAPPLPLGGKTVLVVADPNRAEAYRALALALGAGEVRFHDGMQHPGEPLRASATAADIVVLCTAWCKHAVSAQVRKVAGPRLVEMHVAGVRSFRDTIEALGR